MSIAACLALLASCGPAPGADCDTTGYRCAGAATAMECRDGTWRELPCRGPLGCSVADQQVDCDVSRNRVQDACAESLEGYSICPAGTALLECRGGIFLQTYTCSSCYPSGVTVTCVP
jgi:hypothetical protein